VPSLKNLLTDIAGVRVGHAEDAKVASGTTAIIFDAPAVAAIDVRGGGPGTREGALLDLASTLERVDAIALSGGSSLRPRCGRRASRPGSPSRAADFRVREALIPIVRARSCSICSMAATRHGAVFRPIVTSATPRRSPPDGVCARQRRRRPRCHHRDIQGRARLSFGGDDRRRQGRGDRRVNAVGSVTVGDGPWFWAAPFEVAGEFGGRGLPDNFTDDMLKMRIKGGPAASEARKHHNRPSSSQTRC